MSFALSELLWVGIIPCGVAALVMFFASRVGLPARAAWAKSVVVGYVIGQVGLASRVGWRAGASSLFQPREAGDWLPWLVMAAAGITVLAAYSPRNWQRWIVALAATVAAAAPARLLAGSVYVTARWSLVEKLCVIVAWAAALALTWVLLAAGRINGQPRIRGGLLVVVAIAMAAVLTLTGSFTYGELCGVMAAAIMGAIGSASALVAISKGSPTVSPPELLLLADGLSGAAGAIAMTLGGLVLLGYFYAELSAASAALLIAALVAAGGRLPIAWPHGPIQQTLVRTALCLIPLAVAIAIAVSAIQNDPYR